MDKLIEKIYHNLRTQMGLHRQLLDLVRAERQALVQAELGAIQSATVAKQSLVESIHRIEAERQKWVAELAATWRRPYRDLTLSQIILGVQAKDPIMAEQLRSAYNALTVMIQRISEQNQQNREFVEKSLEHIHQMKKNILGEATQHSATYTQQGQRTTSSRTSRLISKEI